MNFIHSKHPLLYLLTPFSYLYQTVTALRRALYQKNILKVEPLSVPIIVVGNITVGGTGKTPVIIWLAILGFLWRGSKIKVAILR